MDKLHLSGHENSELGNDIDQISLGRESSSITIDVEGGDYPHSDYVGPNDISELDGAAVADPPVFRSVAAHPVSMMTAGALTRGDTEIVDKLDLNSLQVSGYDKLSVKGSAKLGLSFEAVDNKPVALSPLIRLEPSHFTMEDDVSSIVNKLTETLGVGGVQFIFKPEKFKMKCSFDNDNLAFVVRIFTSGNRYLVEFQRRRGSALLFNRVYTTVKESLLGQTSAPITSPISVDLCLPIPVM